MRSYATPAAVILLLVIAGCGNPNKPSEDPNLSDSGALMTVPGSAVPDQEMPDSVDGGISADTASPGELPKP